MSIGEQVRFLRRAIYRGLAERLAERSKVPLSRLWVLSALDHHRVESQAELAEILYVDAPTLSRMLAKLEADGLIARQPGEDRRKFRLALTPRGQAEALTVAEALRAIDERLSAELSQEEVVELERLLAKSARALGTGATQPARAPDEDPV